MVSYKLVVCVCLVSVLGSCMGIFFPSHSSGSGLDGVKKAARWNIPWLGIGLFCNGCPVRSCEDDEAIIHGYCCGCAYHSAWQYFWWNPLGMRRQAKGEGWAMKDQLPVICPEFLQCPLNVHGLCHDYEYMMRCCC